MHLGIRRTRVLASAPVEHHRPHMVVAPILPKAVPRELHTEEATTKDTPRLKGLQVEDTDNLVGMVSHSNSKDTDSAQEAIKEAVVGMEEMPLSLTLVDRQLLAMVVDRRILVSRNGHDGALSYSYRRH